MANNAPGSYGESQFRLFIFFFSISSTGTDAAAKWLMETTLKILAVDNEPSVTLSLRYVFDRPGYEVTTVDSGHAALAQLDRTPEPYDIIIVDQKMPNLTGLELVGEIRERHINSKVIVISAHLSADVCEAYERLNVHVMFSKPFDVDMLRSAVDKLAA
jgi:DNA-binding NtrC family response regulator